MKIDLAAEMAKVLNFEAVETKTNSVKISMALDYLSKASNLFEVSGNHIASEAITIITENIAKTIRK